ncbi:MAG: hypothetical protein HKN97_01250 [Myxococcales bacterium]|nr:hypothetical protein [Deltaproteobacteria bacterium]NND27203.1 hypothetical protein [Myxococcales bacterium]NNK06749.1 hypothetical protein [Myxococcales bacterium]NNK44677.1 hypothetical protein [Myxococcales bacterium]
MKATEPIRFAVRALLVLATVAWQADETFAQAPEPAAEPEASKTDDEETWLTTDATRKDASFVATATETLSRDPRNYFADEEFHQGWIRIPGMPAEVRFGGFIQLNLVHDFQAAGLSTGEFIPSLIPVPTDLTPNTNFDVQSTRFIFESRIKVDKAWTKVSRVPREWVSVFLSMDFAGDTSASTPVPRLRQAYVTYSGLLVGRALGTFFDAQTWPDIFDLEGPNAMTAKRTEMVRFSYGIVQTADVQVPDKVIVTAAIENPETSVTNATNLKAWPGVVARLDLNYDWGHMSFMGIGRQLIAESTAGVGRDSQYAGSGAVNWKINIPGSQARTASAPSDDLLGQVAYGTAGGNYIQDLVALGGQDGYFDDVTQQILTQRQLAAWGGYEHSWADRWHSAFMAGYILVSNLDLEPDDAYQSSIYALTNIIFRPIPRFAIACEYYFGQRRDKDGQRGNAHRLMGVFKFTI